MRKLLLAVLLTLVAGIIVVMWARHQFDGSACYHTGEKCPPNYIPQGEV